MDPSNINITITIKKFATNIKINNSLQLPNAVLKADVRLIDCSEIQVM
ncbi:24964_t:CDS:2 [Cetraspora pellucida]|uniref:24964_t:CDS:1 n=1 Tax=Cetraspora pellucida TaxID=1433469 RepID=A0A9N9F4Y9_9GLOM|nr:24964_t:CDS:2 [Cetraspora pellucida]